MSQILWVGARGAMLGAAVVVALVLGLWLGHAGTGNRTALEAARDSARADAAAAHHAAAMWEVVAQAAVARYHGDTVALRRALPTFAHQRDSLQALVDSLLQDAARPGAGGDARAALDALGERTRRFLASADTAVGACERARHDCEAIVAAQDSGLRADSTELVARARELTATRKLGREPWLAGWAGGGYDLAGKRPEVRAGVTLGRRFALTAEAAQEFGDSARRRFTVWGRWRF